jgi:hypothetical protein
MPPRRGEKRQRATLPASCMKFHPACATPPQPQMNGSPRPLLPTALVGGKPPPANACCFCLLPGGTADGQAPLLTTVLNAPKLHYHEECAVFSSALQTTPARFHGALRDHDVLAEWQRSRGLVCALCNKQGGASVACRGQASCRRSYHLPCARQAAIQATEAGELLPVVFACTPTSREVACPDHAGDLPAEAIIQEPAGPWLEALYGWHGGDVAARGRWLATIKRRNTGTARPFATAPSAAAASTLVRTPFAVPKTYHVEGHTWQTTACVNWSVPPPMRPGERRILGVTVSGELISAFDAVQAAFLKESRKKKGPGTQELRQFVVLGSHPAEELAKAADALHAAVCCEKELGPRQVLRTKVQLPDRLSVDVASTFQVFPIPTNDPREGLAGDLDARGVRARCALEPYSFVGVYAGLQMGPKGLNSLLRDRRLASALKMPVTGGLALNEQVLQELALKELALKVDSYGADDNGLHLVPLTAAEAEEQARNSNLRHEPKPVPEARFVKEALRLGGESWVNTTTAWLYGNETALINDP